MKYRVIISCQKGYQGGPVIVEGVHGTGMAKKVVQAQYPGAVVTSVAQVY